MSSIQRQPVRQPDFRPDQQITELRPVVSVAIGTLAVGVAVVAGLYVGGVLPRPEAATSVCINTDNKPFLGSKYGTVGSLAKIRVLDPLLQVGKSSGRITNVPDPAYNAALWNTTLLVENILGGDKRPVTFLDADTQYALNGHTVCVTQSTDGALAVFDPNATPSK